jgi:hypothetical protein
MRSISRVQRHSATAHNEAAKDRLKVAIARYRAKAGNGLDQDAQKVLDRLAADERAADAFFAVLPNGDRWGVLLSDCITADERARSHAKRIRALQDKIQKAPRALKAAVIIADFFYGPRSKLDLSEEAFALLRAHENGREDPQRLALLRSQINDPINQALSLLRAQIKDTCRHYRQFLSALSRKTDAWAARSEGIGWLRESVQRLSGRPNHKQVAVLAEIVLGTEDIDIGSVRKAVMPRDALRGRKSVEENVVVSARKRKVSRSEQKNQSNGT